MLNISSSTISAKHCDQSSPRPLLTAAAAAAASACCRAVAASDCRLRDCRRGCRRDCRGHCRAAAGRACTRPPGCRWGLEAGSCWTAWCRRKRCFFSGKTECGWWTERRERETTERERERTLVAPTVSKTSAHRIFQPEKRAKTFPENYKNSESIVSKALLWEKRTLQLQRSGSDLPAFGSLQRTVFSKIVLTMVFFSCRIGG